MVMANIDTYATASPTLQRKQPLAKRPLSASSLHRTDTASNHFSVHCPKQRPSAIKPVK